MLRKVFKRGSLLFQGTFEYEILPSEGHIRLLTLLPGKGEEIIRCKLKAVDANASEDQYSAVSYVWGSVEDAVQILCNRKPFFITRNLTDALRAIRQPGEKVMLWADAICINQMDENERNNQVKLMARIYENALKVVVWLGEDTEGIAEDSFSLVRETVDIMDRQVEKYGNALQIPAVTASSQISGNKARWSQINKLCNLTWFSRAWCVQEVGLAKECLLLWGTESLEMAIFMALALYGMLVRGFDLMTGYLELSGIQDRFLGIQCRYTNSKTWRTERRIIIDESNRVKRKPPLFLDILSCAAFLNASNQRDMIYAFLGLPVAQKDDGTLLVEPTYEKTVDEVYLGATVALLNSPREAAWVFHYVQHASALAIRGDTYPSWALRWDNIARSNVQSIYPAMGLAWYSAGGKIFRPQIRDTRYLMVQGFVFDHLSWTSDSLEITNFRFERARWTTKFRELRKSALDVLYEELQVVALDHFKNSFWLFDAFFLTLMRGYPTREQPSPATIMELKENFKVFLQRLRTTALSDHPEPISDGSNPWKIQSHLYRTIDRKLGFTRLGRLALLPQFGEPGDVCCIVQGISVPLVLRETGNGCYNIVGDAYVHGVMAGELLDDGKHKVIQIILE